MRQTFMQKVFERILPILRKITGHKYDCCDRWARCSRCKYVKSSDDRMTMEEAVEILRDIPSSVIQHYCKDKWDVCEYANENGYCRLAACAYRWAKQNDPRMIGGDTE